MGKLNSNNPNSYSFSSNILTLAIIAVCFLKEIISKLPVTIIKSLDIDNNNIGVYKTIITSYELKAKQDTANIAKERLSKIDEKIESRGSKD